MKIDLKQIVHEELNKMLGRVKEQEDQERQEKPKNMNTVDFNNVKYRFRTGVNRNPTKLGIKLQFTPVSGFDSSDPEFRQKQDALLQKFLNKKFQEYGRPSFILDLDTDVPNPNTTGFIIRLGLIESLVDSFFKPSENAQSETPNDRPDTSGDQPNQEQ